MNLDLVCKLSCTIKQALPFTESTNTAECTHPRFDTWKFCFSNCCLSLTVENIHVDVIESTSSCCPNYCNKVQTSLWLVAIQIVTTVTKPELLHAKLSVATMILNVSALILKVATLILKVATLILKVATCMVWLDRVDMQTCFDLWHVHRDVVKRPKASKVDHLLQCSLRKPRKKTQTKQKDTQKR